MLIHDQAAPGEFEKWWASIQFHRLAKTGSIPVGKKAYKVPKIF